MAHDRSAEQIGGTDEPTAQGGMILRELMFDQAPDILCVIDARGHVAEVNEEWTRVLGWERHAIAGRRWHEHVHPDDQRRAQGVLERLGQGAYVRGFEARWRTSDGEYRWLSWNAQGDPATGLVFAVGRDVTEDHEAERLRASQHALEALVTTTAARLVALTSGQLLEGIRRALREVSDVLDVDGAFVYLLPNDRDGMWRLAEWARPGREVDNGCLEGLADEDLAALVAALTQGEGLRWPAGASSREPPTLVAVKLLVAAGAESVLLVPLLHGGVVLGLFGLVAVDARRPWFEAELTLFRVLGDLFASSFRRRVIETELLESEERFRNVVKESPMGMHMYELHADGRLVLVDANPAAARITGLDNGLLLGKTIEAAFPRLAATEAVERFRLAAALGIPWQTTDLYHEDGRNPASFEMYAFQTSPGHVACMFLDVTDRKNTERALRSSERQLRAIFEAAVNVAFVITDAASESPTVVEVSPGAENTFGYSRRELLGEPVRRLLVPDSTQRLVGIYARMRAGGDGYSGEMTCMRSNGEPFPALVRTYPLLDDDGRVHAVLIVSLDVSEQRQLESTLQQAQKMEALGTLAGGIAHDFNNILGAVMGYSELARLSLPAASPVLGHLDQVLAAATRARDLVGQILAFSRRGDQEQRPLDLGPIVREALRMMRASIPATIEIRQRVARDAGVVRANPTQVHQVLMNLCTNAAHAMAESGGVLQVELSPEYLDSTTAATFRDCRPGSYVKLTVRDTGHGIDPAVLGRIFDPYFTTKEKGVGTGLGLAVVHGIVKASSGVIQVASEVGVGTVFDVYFPQVDEESSGETVRPTPVPTGHERILLVDDEEALVTTTRRMLERLGYQVTASFSSEDALERFRRTPLAFDLLVTDQTMPRLTGEQLARKVLAIRPGLPVILCTGFSETMTEEKARDIGIRAFLMKPVLLRTLAVAIRGALDGVAHDAR